MLLSFLIIISLDSISDKLLAFILFSFSSGKLSCSLIWGLFLCPLILAASFYLFLCMSRSVKTLMQTCVRCCFSLALDNLFGAISNPQLVVPFTAPGWKVPSCTPRLDFTSTGPSGGSAKFSKHSEIHLHLQVAG